MRRIFLFVLVLLASFFSCKKDKAPYTPIKTCSDLTRNKDTILLYIKGRWNWLEDKAIGRDGSAKYSTPTIKGYTEELEFFEDKAIFYRDHQITASFKYKILLEKEVSFGPDDNNNCLVLYDLSTGNFKQYYPVKICKDYLILQQTYRSDYEPDRTFKRKF